MLPTGVDCSTMGLAASATGAMASASVWPMVSTREEELSSCGSSSSSCSGGTAPASGSTGTGAGSGMSRDCVEQPMLRTAFSASTMRKDTEPWTRTMSPSLVRMSRGCSWRTCSLVATMPPNSSPRSANSTYLSAPRQKPKQRRAKDSRGIEKEGSRDERPTARMTYEPGCSAWS